MSEANNQKKDELFYSLSVFLKHGEILHLEHLREEEKNQYFSLCRNKEAHLLLENEEEVRNILSRDIVKITSVEYDENYYKRKHKLNSMFFSQTSVGESFFKGMKRFMWVIGFLYTVLFGLIVVNNGTALEAVGSVQMTLDMVGDWISYLSIILIVLTIPMIVMNVIDVLSKPSIPYFVNRDGVEEVTCSRLDNIKKSASVFVFVIILNLIFAIAVNFI